MMTNIDSSNQQLINLKDRLDRARTTTVNNEEKLSDLKTKHEKLGIVAKNYGIDPKHAKDYLAVIIIDKMRPDRVTMEARNKLHKAD